MAILQSRMIALINAAIDYQNGFRQAVKLIHEANDRVQKESPLTQGEIARTELLGLVLKANDLNLLEDSGRSQATISGEHYRYSVNKKRNEWNREYQRKRRGGVTTKHHLEPDYATEEFSTAVSRITPFRSERQNQRGFTVNKADIEYIPGELSEKAKTQIEKEIERSLGTDIPRGEELKISNEEVDPDFPGRNRG